MNIFSIEGLCEVGPGLRQAASDALLETFSYEYSLQLLSCARLGLDCSQVYPMHSWKRFLILFAIGLGDYFWSRHTWLQKLRMTKQDLKEEFKESEGSPEVKARMRRLQMEASQKAAEQSQAIEDVKDATVIITNPTHFAVAIKYEPSSDDAPIILAMGKDIMAKRVIEQAELHSKTIVRSPILARALFFTGNIGQAISEQLYSAVASILAYVYQLERGVETTLQEPEVPKDFIFDENGKAV